MQEEIKIDVVFLEHLANCLANQKYLHEMKPEQRKVSQKVIDKAWRRVMSILSPIKKKKATARRSYQKFALKWNKDIDDGLIDNLIAKCKKLAPKTKKEQQWVHFMWGQLVLQECRMWASLGEQVTKNEFDFICKRRGFDKYMRQYLKDMVKHMGLGRKL